MTVLVTGGAGFIGSHLVAALVKKNQPVVVLDNFNSYYDPARKWSNAAELAKLDGVEIVEGDFCDAEAMAELFAKHKFQYVIHLGATPGVPYSVTHPAEVLHNNVQGTLA